MKRDIWVVLLIMCLGDYAFSGEIDSKLKDRLDGLEAGDVIEVIIELKEQADVSSVKGNRSQVITRLQRTANNTQSRILSFLTAEKGKNKVIRFQSYYIFNGLFVECTKETVLQLADFTEIREYTTMRLLL